MSPSHLPEITPWAGVSALLDSADTFKVLGRGELQLSVLIEMMRRGAPVDRSNIKTLLKELGEATSEELSAFLEITYNVKVEPRFISILRASVREKELLENFRQTVKFDASQPA